MTLKLRNRLFIVLFVIAIACILAATAVWISALLSHAVTPPSALRLPRFFTRFAFMRYHFAATVISIALLVVYVPTVVLIIYRAFENTQSSEIIFFSGFLLACLCEGSRILIPLYALGESFSQFQLFSGRILLIGRLLAPMSFIAAAIMSDTEHRQDIERNYMIMVAAATLFALITPLNTAELTTSCSIPWGFPRLVAIIRVFMILAASTSFWINGYNHDSKELKFVAGSTIILFCGYQLLAVADNFPCLVVGTVLLGCGTYLTLSKLHTLYMWK